MGWYFGYRERGLSTIDYLVQDGVLVREKVKASSTQTGVTYIAYEVEPNKMMALVLLTSWSGRDFGYKPQDEGMGPCNATAPEKVLNALSPLEDLFDTGSSAYQWAKEWREKCKDYNNKPRPRKGQTVRFSEPLHFSNGDVLDTFIYEKGNTFKSATSWGRYSITWKERDYEVMDA